MVPPGEVYLEWVKQGGVGSQYNPLHLNPSPNPSPGERLTEGTAAQRQPLRGGEREAGFLSVHKDFSYVSIRPKQAPNIAQLTSQHRPCPANPCCSPPLQGAVCEPIVKVRVLFPVTPPSLLKCTLPIWVIICYESKMPITNNKGFRLLVVTLEDLKDTEGWASVRIFGALSWGISEKKTWL